MPDIFKKIALFYESTKKLQKIMNTTSLSRALLSRIVGHSCSCLLLELTIFKTLACETKKNTIKHTCVFRGLHFFTFNNFSKAFRCDHSNQTY